MRHAKTVRDLIIRLAKDTQTAVATAKPQIHSHNSVNGSHTNSDDHRSSSSVHFPLRFYNSIFRPLIDYINAYPTSVKDTNRIWARYFAASAWKAKVEEIRKLNELRKLKINNNNDNNNNNEEKNIDNNNNNNEISTELMYVTQLLTDYYESLIHLHCKRISIDHLNGLINKTPLDDLKSLCNLLKEIDFYQLILSNNNYNNELIWDTIIVIYKSTKNELEINSTLSEVKEFYSFRCDKKYFPHSKFYSDFLLAIIEKQQIITNPSILINSIKWIWQQIQLYDIINKKESSLSSSPSIIELLLKCVSQQRDWKMINEIISYVEDKNRKLNLSEYHILIDALHEAGRIEDANRLQTQLSETLEFS